jgi:RNA 2',3'-cyclic 3'-phosphodiesterase
VRLFTALWPPGEVVDALAVHVGEAPRGWRLMDPPTWHVTLAFHGEADPGVLARRLDAAAHGMSAPGLRLAGAGRFDGVRWAGVEADVPLDALVSAAGGDTARFVPHLTVLRLRPRPGPGVDPDPSTPWSGHVGSWWRPDDVLLVASEPARGGNRFRVVHRVPLGVARR